jgi:DNA-binding MarR family transcriptional regulator
MEIDRAKLIEEIIANTQQMMLTMSHFATEAWLDLNLTIVQFKSLCFIDSEVSTNFKNLASALGVTPPSVTGIIDRLVEQGLVSREENPDNRRMQILRTTPAGKILLNKLIASRTNVVTQFLNQLNLRDLSDLSRILANLTKLEKYSQAEKKNELISN